VALEAMMSKSFCLKCVMWKVAATQGQNRLEARIEKS
jgi:hypothetical protein